jgi:hypothetical protein
VNTNFRQWTIPVSTCFFCLYPSLCIGLPIDTIPWYYNRNIACVSCFQYIVSQPSSVLINHRIRSKEKCQRTIKLLFKRFVFFLCRLIFIRFSNSLLYTLKHIYNLVIRSNRKNITGNITRSCILKFI